MLACLSVLAFTLTSRENKVNNFNLFISDPWVRGRRTVPFQALSLCIVNISSGFAVVYNAVLHPVRLLIQTLHSSQGDQRWVYVFALRKRRLFGRQELRMGKVYTCILFIS